MKKQILSILLILSTFTLFAAKSVVIEQNTGSASTTAASGTFEIKGDATSVYWITSAGSTKYYFAPLDSPVFTTGIILNFATASTILAVDGSKNVISLDTATYPSLTELSYVKGVTSAIQTQFSAKQNLASSRYAKGNISGAVTIDYSNGDYQACTTTATVTGITISNLATETGIILLIDNSGGHSVTFGSTEIIAATETGVYACAFYNDNGTIYFMGKGERQN